MRGDVPEQVVDPPSASLGCTLGFPPSSRIRHGQNTHAAPGVSAGPDKGSYSPLSVPRGPQCVHLLEAGGVASSESIADPAAALTC